MLVHFYLHNSCGNHALRSLDYHLSGPGCGAVFKPLEYLHQADGFANDYQYRGIQTGRLKCALEIENEAAQAKSQEQ